MKRKWFYFVVALLFIGVLAHPESGSADSTNTVTTKVMVYKGQQYIQLAGGDRVVINKLNKLFKEHAVKAASSNRKLKKENASYSYTTQASTKYNKANKISVMYTDYVYTGGAHGMYGIVMYNYDLKTGKSYELKDYIQNQTQKNNLKNAISASLQAKYDAGENVFEDRIYDFPLEVNTDFYYYQKGIVVVFYPYEVAPYAEGIVSIKVPFDTINKTN
ncbi:DUF3298 and DUF4163 domain-containing protein [Paenibacillus wulumuqiensis]|uniref:DUF3298 and DUF4163 domain-containing protein n=1 Tax=Paenibacillus wulumuqiensis TaxID=1567107 RepID=UPI0006195F92|nr:DUF3298 and DUF4163 domain-containing protein [Paenibacillus wulumuqiensis]